MKISIVTACYNALHTLPETLQSVADQSHEDIEHIIVDGDSQDGTSDFLENYAAPIKWISEADNGIYAAINKGIQLATGDVIGILNSDDQFYDDNIIHQIAVAFAENETLDAVIGDIIFMNNGKVTRHYSAKNWNPSKFPKGIMPPHPSFFMRRATYEKHGLYKEDYEIAADFELLMRYISVLKINYKYLPIITTKMRPGGASTKSWRSNIKLNQEIYRACHENGIPTNYFNIYSKYPSRLLEYFNFG